MAKRKDISGQRFNRLVAISYVPCKNSDRHSRWIFKCDCGEYKKILSWSVLSGRTTSCGCVQRERSRLYGKTRKHNLIGRRFGRLEVTGTASNNGRAVRWMCKCDCGRVVAVIAASLTKKNGLGTKSCGCLVGENLKLRRHPLADTHRYKMWIRIKSRAKRRGIPFSLTLQEMPEIPAKCPYLKIDLKPSGKTVSEESPTLDRRDSRKGYVAGNVQVISHKANTIKSNATFEEFERMYLSWRDSMRVGG